MKTKTVFDRFFFCLFSFEILEYYKKKTKGEKYDLRLYSCQHRKANS